MDKFLCLYHVKLKRYFVESLGSPHYVKIINKFLFQGGINISEEQMLEYLNMMTEFYIAYIVNKNSFTSIDITHLDLDDTISSWISIHEYTVQFATKFNWTSYLKFKDKIDPAKNR